MSDFSHVSGARENESLANSLDPENGEERNWIVTIRFYSLLHYIEERLQAEGYESKNHNDRERKIRRCKSVDNKLYKLYRMMFDLSRDARYECVRMSSEDVEESEKRLEECKNLTGFSHGGGSHKYST